ncbi:xylan glycosyltransferase MUCI21-like [Cornus florida]|uniref:xylan glycosyltransferase MUCI21-like n=1 Tax=Cornus florida TaxID=4283 RepID=UPI00289B1CC6|nr:xylan glycosyltransferase MUCI21-like [Cornus florida]
MKVEAMKRTTMMVMVLFLMLLVFRIVLLSICRLHTMYSFRSDSGTTLLRKLKHMSPLEPHSVLKQMSPMENRSAPRVRSSLASPITCDRSNHRYDICSINGPTVLDTSQSTFFVVGPENSKPLVEKVRPYPRKWESFTMGRIKELTLTSGSPSPPCEVQHNVPALVFSAGGYTGNFFHDFNDGFIPLFITVNSVLPDKDFVLVISKSRDWWVHKYANLLRSFSKHTIINLDNDNVTHCFPSATLGLMSHGFMTIDPKLIPNSRTIQHFHALLEKTYGQGHPSFSIPPKARPRLLLASRSGGVGRVILNQAEVEKVAREEGFDVTVFEPKSSTPLREAYVLIHSSHVMIGVHGAALTHSLFLRPGSVFVQVVPIGSEWVAEACFGKPARDMGLEYMEYKIGVEESSLVEKYGKDEVLLKDPQALLKKGWSNEIMDIYLKKQNVKFDLVRFRGYLKIAYEKAEVFMNKEC